MYNYLENIIEDVKEAIRNDYITTEFADRDELEEKLNEYLWIDDSVTGNASGSYTFNRYTAKEYVTDNIDLLDKMCAEFDTTAEEIGEKFLNEEWEWMDVSIRCYLLSQAISEALDEMEDDLIFADTENEETETA